MTDTSTGEQLAFRGGVAACQWGTHGGASGMLIETLPSQHPKILAECAVAERLRRRPGVELHPTLFNTPLIYGPEGAREEMTGIYREYIDAAGRASLPLLLTAPTWRLDATRVAEAEVPVTINRDAVAFLVELRDRHANGDSPVLVGALSGPKNDCYRPDLAPDSQEAEEFHTPQIRELATTAADFLIAQTLPAVGEAIGVARAMAATDKPYLISFCVGPDGRVLDGTGLTEVMERIDADPGVARPPVGYFVNCTHPSFLLDAYQPGELERLIGIQANGSSRDVTALDGSSATVADPVDRWAASMLALHERHGVPILGGCCGTSLAHLEALGGSGRGWCFDGLTTGCLAFTKTAVSRSIEDRRVDLRSDTVTRPSPAMRQAMAGAEVGDDVLGDDPTVAALEQRMADMLGKEAALFVPSGTMANAIAVRSHTEPGDEIVAEIGSHVYVYEGGGYAALSGCSIALVDGVRGLMAPSDVERAIRKAEGSMSHFPNASLVWVENSANRGGGTVYPVEDLDAIAELSRRHECATHLDGARLFNAAVASATAPARLVRHYDSVSVCLSKGLGAPVGSVFAGSASLLKRAHRWRKLFGGGMRQAGVLAAAGLHALDHHIERLADDHARARRLAKALAGIDGFSIDLEAVQTNMVYITCTDGRSAADVEALLAENGVDLLALGPDTLRAVTHLHISDADIERTIEVFAANAG